MHCPRCRTLLINNTCPRCNPRTADSRRTDERGRQRPIQFRIETPDRVQVRSEGDNWRMELRKKINQRAARGPDEFDLAADDGEPELDREEIPELERPLFQSRPQPAAGEARPVTYQATPAAQMPVLDSPLIRMPGRSTSPPSAPLQREFNLELPPSEPPSSALPAFEEPDDYIEELSREILFSRLLAGIIDLLLPSLIGLVLAFAASYILNFDFLGPSALRLIGLQAVAFFFFNSIFFLMASGQTPGMYLTDLRLSCEDPDEEVSPGRIMLRVALFLPALLSGIGLVWAVFEPGRRCLHDTLSGTRVLPRLDT